MQKSIAKFAQSLVKGAVLSVAMVVSLTAVREVSRRVAIPVNTPKAKAASLMQQDLFFGRNIPGGKQVSQAQFQPFVDTPETKTAIRSGKRFTRC